MMRSVASTTILILMTMTMCISKKDVNDKYVNDKSSMTKQKLKTGGQISRVQERCILSFADDLTYSYKIHECKQALNT